MNLFAREKLLHTRLSVQELRIYLLPVMLLAPTLENLSHKHLRLSGSTNYKSLTQNVKFEDNLMNRKYDFVIYYPCKKRLFAVTFNVCNQS